MAVNFFIDFLGLWVTYPGVLLGFLPCQPSAHFARLSHLGWRRYGHGLSSRPRESCDHQILAPLLDFFGYPDGAATELFKEITFLAGFSSFRLYTGGWSRSWNQRSFSGS